MVTKGGPSKANVIDVTEENFDYAVVSASQSRPVLLDFWGEHCAPCKILSPLLESIAEEFDGAFLLAKIDVDQAPQLAVEFQIENLPTLLLVKEGKIVDRVVGAPSEQQIRTFLRKHVTMREDKVAQGGWQLERSGDLDAAREAYEKVLAGESENAEARLGLARVSLARLDLDAATDHLKNVDDTTSFASQAEWHRDALDFWREAKQGREKPGDGAEAEPAADDDEAQLRHAARLAGDRKYEGALETLLGILTRNSRFRDELPRKAMLSLFGFLGEKSALVRKFQDRMASALF